MNAYDTQLTAHLTINEIPSVAIQGSKIASKQSRPGATKTTPSESEKTELTWFRSKTNLDVADINLNFYIGPDIIIKLVNLDRDLGVYLFISMKYNISHHHCYSYNVVITSIIILYLFIQLHCHRLHRQVIDPLSTLSLLHSAAKILCHHHIMMWSPSCLRHVIMLRHH